MKIVCISDTHSMHDSIKNLPDGDVLIHAGDFTGKGDPDRVREFDEWLGKQPHKTKIVVPGNHELTFQHNPDSVHGLITNAHLLIDRSLVIDGVKFYGSPWQPFFHNWAYNISLRARLKQIWEMIPDDTQVLITHCPPHSILDCVPQYDKGDQFVGCKDLYERVIELKPELHVFGHIHESYGTKVLNGTTFLNASICDGRYRPVNKPLVYEIKGIK